MPRLLAATFAPQGELNLRSKDPYNLPQKRAKPIGERNVLITLYGLCCRTLCANLFWFDLVFGIDVTIERLRGAKIKAEGVHRDPARSFHSRLVKAIGLYWLCRLLLVEPTWAGEILGLSFLTVFRSLERYHDERGRATENLI
jgi:hypothetical protein